MADVPRVPADGGMGCWHRKYCEDEEELLPLYVRGLKPKTEGSLRRRLLSAKIHQKQDALWTPKPLGGPSLLHPNTPRCEPAPPVSTWPRTGPVRHKQNSTAVSEQEEEFRWTVFYAAPCLQQGKHLQPQTPHSCVQDLHRHSNGSLKPLLPGKFKLKSIRPEYDKLSSSSHYPEDPSLCPSHLSNGAAQGECEEVKKPTGCLTTQNLEFCPGLPTLPEDTVKLSHSDWCPTSTHKDWNPTSTHTDWCPTSTHTDWCRTLPLPTPEEKMKQQALAVLTEIIPINITGETFDRQASIRHSLISQDTVMNVPKHRKAEGLQDIQEEAVQAGLCHETAATQHPLTRDSSCQTERGDEAEEWRDDVEERIVLPSKRRTLAQRGQAILTHTHKMSASWCGNICSCSDHTAEPQYNSLPHLHRASSSTTSPQSLEDQQAGLICGQSTQAPSQQAPLHPYHQYPNTQATPSYPLSSALPSHRCCTARSPCSEPSQSDASSNITAGQWEYQVLPSSPISSHCSTNGDRASLCSSHGDRASMCSSYGDRASLCSSHGDRASLCSSHGDRDSLCSSHGDRASLCSSHGDRASLCSSHGDRSSLCHSILLRKAKKPPPPPTRKDSLSGATSSATPTSSQSGSHTSSVDSWVRQQTSSQIASVTPFPNPTCATLRPNPSPATPSPNPDPATPSLNLSPAAPHPSNAPIQNLALSKVDPSAPQRKSSIMSSSLPPSPPPPPPPLPPIPSLPIPSPLPVSLIPVTPSIPCSPWSSAHKCSLNPPRLEEPCVGYEAVSGLRTLHSKYTASQIPAPILQRLRLKPVCWEVQQCSLGPKMGDILVLTDPLELALPSASPVARNPILPEGLEACRAVPTPSLAQRDCVEQQELGSRAAQVDNGYRESHVNDLSSRNVDELQSPPHSIQETGLPMYRRSSAVLQNLISPSDLQSPSSPSDLQNPSSPSNPQNPSSSADFQNPSSPSGLQNPSSPSDFQNPSSPSDLQNPSSPSDLQNPSSPSDLQNPSGPSDLQNPNNSADIHNSVSPADLHNPSNPSGLQNPSSPSDLQNPSSPSDLQNPSGPSDLQNTSSPSDLQNPNNSADIHNSVSPADLHNPSNPSDLQNSSSPSDLQNPSNPSDHQNPNSPSDLLNPNSPSDLLNPNSPADLQNPSNPSDLQNPHSPSDLQNPHSPADLQNPNSPADLQNPNSPADLQNPNSPSDLQNPNSPADLQNPSSPSDLQNPSSPSDLQNPNSPSDLQNPNSPADLQNPSNPSDLQNPSSPPDLPNPTSFADLQNPISPADFQYPSSPAVLQNSCSPEELQNTNRSADLRNLINPADLQNTNSSENLKYPSSREDQDLISPAELEYLSSPADLHHPSSTVNPVNPNSPEDLHCNSSSASLQYHSYPAEARDSDSDCSGSISPLDEKNADVFEEMLEELLAPAPPRTTEELFTAIHRSKRKLLGQKWYEERHVIGCERRWEEQRVIGCRRPWEEQCVIGCGRLWEEQRVTGTCASRCSGFRALLQRKSRHAARAPRMSAAQMLQCSAPISSMTNQGLPFCPSNQSKPAAFPHFQQHRSQPAAPCPAFSAACFGPFCLHGSGECGRSSVDSPQLPLLAVGNTAAFATGTAQPAPRMHCSREDTPPFAGNNDALPPRYGPASTNMPFDIVPPSLSCSYA